MVDIIWSHNVSLIKTLKNRNNNFLHIIDTPFTSHLYITTLESNYVFAHYKQTKQYQHNVEH